MYRMVQLGNTSTQAIYDKFGDFTKFEELNPGGFFTEFHLFELYSARGNKLRLRNNVTVHEFRSLWLFHLAWAIPYLLVFIKRQRISLIDGKEPHLCGAVALILSKLTRVPFCVSLYCDYDLAYKNKTFGPFYQRFHGLLKMWERFVLSRADMVLPIRDSLARYAVNSGAKPEKVRVIPLGVEVAPFLRPPDAQLKEELGGRGKKIVSFAGRLCKENYVEDIIKIASAVCRERKDVIFLLVGDGNERGRLEQLSDTLQLNDNVRFLGFQSQERATQIRLISDVSLCLMGGYSLIEAAMAHTPLVAYNVDWHYELVRDNETGFLLPEGDTQGATDAILKILRNPELGILLGGNARKLAIERHSPEYTNRVMADCYKELIDGQRSR